MRPAFYMFGGAADSSAVTIAKYVVVGYKTLKHRCKQLYEYRGEWPWEFVAALVTVESGMSYTAYNSSGAAGLFAIKPVAAQFIRVSYADMRKSVPLQLRAGKKLLADYRTRIKGLVPELLESSGEDLYAVAYLYHNLGIGAAPTIIKKVKAAGKPVTWQNLKGYVTGGMVTVINRIITLAGQYQARYAELIEDQDVKVAQYGEGLEEQPVELAAELTQNAEEGDGESVPIPSSLDDYGPEPLPDGTTLQESTSAARGWVMPVVIGVVAAAALAGGAYVLVRSRRRGVSA